MKKGDYVYTPRFCTVQILEVFESLDDMLDAGYTESTHYRKDGYVVYGKSLDLYHMVFAACKA